MKWLLTCVAFQNGPPPQMAQREVPRSELDTNLIITSPGKSFEGMMIPLYAFRVRLNLTLRAWSFALARGVGLRLI